MAVGFTPGRMAGSIKASINLIRNMDSEPTPGKTEGVIPGSGEIVKDMDEEI